MAEVDIDPSGPFDRPDSRFNTLAGWTWIGSYGGYHLQCDQLAAFEHGFFTRLWHGRPPEVLAGYLSAGVTVHRTRQVHGAIVLPATAAAAEPWPEADALVSDLGGQSLWVCGADCTPVLIADPINGRVASCHAGWRGVAAGILHKTVAALRPDPSNRGDLLVALGPAISGETYQVETGVALTVARSLTQAGEAGDDDLRRLRGEGVLLDDPEPDRLRLDIRLAATQQLLAAGVERKSIQICPLCTHSHPDLFHSWRRDQVKAVQWSGIVSQTPDRAEEFSENEKTPRLNGNKRRPAIEIGSISSLAKSALITRDWGRPHRSLKRVAQAGPISPPGRPSTNHLADSVETTACISGINDA